MYTTYIHVHALCISWYRSCTLTLLREIVASRDSASASLLQVAQLSITPDRLFSLSRENMCILTRPRRKSNDVKVLPSHLLRAPCTLLCGTWGITPGKRLLFNEQDIHPICTHRSRLNNDVQASEGDLQYVRCKASSRTLQPFDVGRFRNMPSRKV
jgi:hypothetical protein